MVVRATGQDGPAGMAELLAALGVEARDGVVAAALTGRTSNPKVWAIGDIANGGAEVVNAVQAGKLAARSIVDALGLGAPRVVPARPTDATVPGVDLSTDMAGIRSPNPFWLASCPITNTGEMQSPDQYGAATVLGFDLEAGGDYLVNKQWFVHAGLKLATIGFSFKGAGTLSNNRDGDPTTIDVSGARDTYYGAIVTAGYLY